RAILVGKQSGRLRRSQKFKTIPGGKVEAGSDLDYAGIHNKGGQLKVKVTAKSRRFFWAMWYQTKNDMWKAMALTKKRYMTITIPKRQFIGPSPVLDKMIETMIDKRLKRIL
ncbi:MAG: phage virion morphogenesis protein, partial [Pseudomonadales bacterium]